MVFSFLIDINGTRKMRFYLVENGTEIMINNRLCDTPYKEETIEP